MEFRENCLLRRGRRLKNCDFVCMWLSLFFLGFALWGVLTCSYGYDVAFQWKMCPIPYGLVVRIRRSHRRGPGSIPGVGTTFFFPMMLCCV